DTATFLIRANPERKFGCERLGIARHLGDLFRRLNVTPEIDYPAQIEVPREPAEILGNGMASESRQRELADMAAHILHGHPRNYKLSQRFLTVHRCLWRHAHHIMVARASRASRQRDHIYALSAAGGLLIATWTISQSPASSTRLATCSKSRTKTRSRFGHT